MKTSAVLASLLFGAFAVAAPVDKRAVVTTTQVVTETVVVYTTVYDYEEGPAPTSSQGLFYEQPAQSTTAAAAPAYTPPAPVAPSNAYTPAPAPTPEAPKEEPKPTSAAYVAPAPVSTPVAPAPAPAPEPSKPASNNNQVAPTAEFTGVDLTIYNGNGDLGACGKKIMDGELVAAIGPGAWGKSTYDVMTGEATNPMCGQKIQVNYNGRSVTATVLDLCPGCLGPNDVDLTMAAFKVVTGSEEITRYHGASWSKVN